MFKRSFDRDIRLPPQLSEPRDDHPTMELLTTMLARAGLAFWTMLRRQEGQTMAEYGILIAVIAIVVIVAAALLGSSISALFNSTAGQV